MANGGLISASMLTPSELGCETANPATPWLAIPTSNRDDILVRTLRSYNENSRRFDRVCDTFVCDGSLDPKSTTRLSLAQLLREHNLKIWYGGIAEKERFAKK